VTRAWRIRGGAIPLDRARILGVVNVTPDSFSDGGRHATEDEAVAHGLKLLAEGADVLDVGGESTRPGAAPVPEAEEIRRVAPVVRRLAEVGAVVSVDTVKARVAEAALDAGARIVNDVTAGRDPAMLPLVAREGAGVVLMHMQGEPRTMQQDPRYHDVVKEVAQFLHERARAARDAGIPPDAVALDPGLGFGKTQAHNLELVRGLPEIRRLGHPVLVGASRKAFLGALTGGAAPADRVEASVAAHVLAVARGADLVRVHDVQAHKRALAVADSILEGKPWIA
jgi:dihydropteroate synthase